MKNALLAAMTVGMLAGCRASDNDALIDAIRAKDTKQVDRILAEGAVNLDPPQQPYQVNKPLAYAAAYGNLDIVKLILREVPTSTGRLPTATFPLSRRQNTTTRTSSCTCLNREQM